MSLAAQRLAIAQGRAAYSQEALQERTSMAEEKAMLQRSATLLRLSEERAALIDQRNKTLSAAYAIHHFSELNPADPQFKEKYYQGLKDFHEGLDDVGVQKLIASKQQDFQRFEAANHEALLANYTPTAQKAYQDMLAKTGDPTLANIAAKGATAQMDQINKLAASKYLTDAEKAKYLNRDTGHFDIEGALSLEAQRQGTEGNNKNSFDHLAQQNEHFLKVIDTLRGKGKSKDSLSPEEQLQELQNPGSATKGKLDPVNQKTVDMLSQAIQANVAKMTALSGGQGLPGTAAPGAPVATPDARNTAFLRTIGAAPSQDSKGAAMPAPASAPVEAPVAAPAGAPTPAPSPVSQAESAIPGATGSEVAANDAVTPAPVAVSELPEGAAEIPAQPFDLASTAQAAIQQPGVPPVNPDDQEATA